MTKKINKLKQEQPAIITNSLGVYPFINPIILSSDNGIIDGNHRFQACRNLFCDFESIQIPYSSSQLNNIECINLIKEIKEKQSKTLEKWFNDNNVNYLTQLKTCGSDDKFYYFNKYKDKFITDEEYTKQLSSIYQMSSNAFKYKNEIKMYFTSEKLINEFLMTAEELQVFNTLPEELTIYRGMYREEFENKDYGFSWTLDKNVAEFFADGYIHNYNKINEKGIVVELNICKKDVIAYLNERSEKEIIYIHST